MKTFLLFVFMVVAQDLFAQKIVQNEIDKFSKEKRVETSHIELVDKFSESMRVKLRSVGDTYFALFYGTGRGTGVIGPNDDMVFLLDNDSTIKINPTGIQSYEVSTSASTYYKDHQYRIYKEQLQLLSEHNIKSIRKYTSKGYADFEIKDKHKDNFKKLAILFLKNL